jgi:hypothetical protein
MGSPPEGSTFLDPAHSSRIAFRSPEVNIPIPLREISTVAL